MVEQPQVKQYIQKNIHIRGTNLNPATPMSMRKRGREKQILKQVRDDPPLRSAGRQAWEREGKHAGMKPATTAPLERRKARPPLRPSLKTGGDFALRGKGPFSRLRRDQDAPSGRFENWGVIVIFNFALWRKDRSKIIGNRKKRFARAHRYN
jgi:hypothetical protein